MPELSDKNLTFVIGFSMFPTLQPGDEVVLFEKCKFAPGDVIGYQIEKKCILHRIIKIKKGKIYTKGDNCINIGPYSVTQENIIGKLIKIRRDNRTYKISNGFPGYLTGKKCLIIKQVKVSVFIVTKSIYKFKPIVRILDKIGQGLFIRHLSIIKQSNHTYMIYYGKVYCGSYNSNKKEWMLRNRFKPFFSHNKLQKIVCLIDIKNN